MKRDELEIRLKKLKRESRRHELKFYFWGILAYILRGGPLVLFLLITGITKNFYHVFGVIDLFVNSIGITY